MIDDFYGLGRGQRLVLLSLMVIVSIVGLLTLWLIVTPVCAIQDSIKRLRERAR